MKLFPAILFLLLPLLARSSAISFEQAQYAQDRVTQSISDPGIVSIGIGGCNPQTGVEGKNAYGQFNYCVIVITDGPTSAQRLLRHLPIKSKISGVYIYIKAGSPVDPYPRMSGGS